ncbi:hypothetical protein Ami103574_12555 [Aminipila butyrica]|uniref:Uncharacterized protein n=1 Tax=Aminipila butyrica TaxID=433296 RepID=A0A858BVV5_9FIRM|nr:hypothetical protein [Aminipila butyrica]QIB70073.1 hypothetical protein Ami103574_12555 [Aminipila butyrica]
MNINSIMRNEYSNQRSKISNTNLINKLDDSKSARAMAKRDSVEISAEAYGRKENSKEPSATSGKDTLGITKGSGEDSYVVHFSDSAMVSRAVSRGYITVNGTDIPLTDEVKAQLTAVDKQAQADREVAYNKYIMQHEMAVAKQQAEAWKHAFDVPDYLSLLLGQKTDESSFSKNDSNRDGVSWSQFERKYYETTMNISMKGTPEIQDIQENEMILNKGE